VNTSVSWPGDVVETTVAWHRVLAMQTKLHRWATADPDRRFDDLFNLVHDPAFLLAAWDRVRGNKGGRTAGVDGVVPRFVPAEEVTEMLAGLRDQVKSGEFAPMPVRQRRIPKAGGKFRSLGIPTMLDRIIQASLKLVLEPIFDADFEPSSYGFRPRRRAQDAVAEIHFYTTGNRSYEWVFEGDIKACFDEIDHSALMERVRGRVADKRVLGLVRAFLKSGVLTEDGLNRDTRTGTPQGGILSPLLANIALSVLDEHFTTKWEALGPSWTRAKHLRAGGATMKLVRYADDFVVLVRGPRASAEALFGEVAAVITPMGLSLSQEDSPDPHRGRLRLSRLAHPAPDLARTRRAQANGLHLPIEEVTCFDQGEDPAVDASSSPSNARRPPAPAQPGDQGLVRPGRSFRVLSPVVFCRCRAIARGANTIVRCASIASRV